MWRGTLITVGFCISTVLSILLLSLNGLWTPVIEFFCRDPDNMIAQSNISDRVPVEFPEFVGNTSLVIEKLISYTGVYTEDRSFDPVTDIAALVVTNTGENMIAETEIVMYSSGLEYCFKATRIPPGKTVLLLDHKCQRYQETKIYSISGFAQEEPCRREGQFGILVERAGLDHLAITNCTNQFKENIRIYYKATDTTGRLLLGGITHSLQISSLKPGETVYVKPEYFAQYNSMIVQMCY